MDHKKMTTTEPCTLEMLLVLLLMNATKTYSIRQIGKIGTTQMVCIETWSCVRVCVCVRTV